jgi:predicted PurR-regulated permease PerM
VGIGVNPPTVICPTDWRLMPYLGTMVENEPHRTKAPPPQPPRLGSDDEARFVRRLLLVLGLTTLLVAVGLLLWSAAEIFLLAFAAILLAVFLNTPARFASDRTGLPHGVALALTALALIGLLVVGSWLMGPRLAEQTRELANQLPNSVRELRDMVEGWPAGPWLVEQMTLQDGLDFSGVDVVSRVTGTASLLWDAAAKLVFVVFLAVFLASAPRKYRDGTVRLFPKVRQERALEVMNTLGRTLQGWLLGQLGAMILVGLLTTLGLWAIGVPLALVLGVIAGLFEFVPIVGPFLAFIPAGLLALSQDMSTFLWVVALYVLIQQLEGNVIVPLLQRRTVDLPPPLTIAAVFVFGAAFGALGLLIAVPLLAVTLVLVKMLYLKQVLHERVQVPGGNDG